MILALYGAGGVGKEIMELISAYNKRTNQWEDFLFIDDVTQEKEIMGYEVYSFSEFTKRYAPEDNVEIIITLGDPINREKLFHKLKNEGYQFGKAIFDSPFVSMQAKYGRGVLIYANTLPGSVEIGDNVMILGGADIGHEAVIGNHCVISSQVFIGGHTVVGNNVFIGAHAALKDSISVGNNAAISLGAAVFNSVPENAFAFGNPARSMQRRDNEHLFG